MVARIRRRSADALLIEDLLTYTVARDRPLELQGLDLSDLAERTAQMRRVDNARPIIDSQPRMRVQADRVLVRQLVDNLILTAVKYVTPGVRPRIEMTADIQGDMLEVSNDGQRPVGRARIFGSRFNQPVAVSSPRQPECSGTGGWARYRSRRPG